MNFTMKQSILKYKMGGTGQNGIDCSAFTQKCLKKNLTMHFQDLL